MNRPIPFGKEILLGIMLSVATLTLLTGCKNEKNAIAGNCATCHQITVDPSHQIPCTTCHQGNDQSRTVNEAHVNLVSRPAHPDNFQNTCGNCHKDEVAELKSSLHYTLQNFVNLVRSSYGEKEPLAHFSDIPVPENPEDISQLVDDLLRRRCLRCHLYSSGDEYSATSHATGCGACHLEYTDGKLDRHRFTASPTDKQCLACHYGNRVGFDYYGRAEHDFNVEYRTPYTVEDAPPRPYGVEYHELAPDIHQQAGLLCIDCHGRDELMKSEQAARKPSCRGCHAADALKENTPDGVITQEEKYLFKLKASGKMRPLPLMQHSAHTEYPSVSCQACHAQWSFNDTQTHLLRSDTDEYEHWARLTVQGSSEVELFLEHNLDYNNTELPPEMTDKITGDIRAGVWYKGYTMRRWEWPLLGRTEDGIITVVRPVLDITLSWVDEDEIIRFDGYGSSAANSGMLPYTPHTTGPAGMFYEQRIREFLTAEKTQGM
jgi:hypothetical protein